MLRILTAILLAAAPAVSQVTPELLSLLPDETKVIAGVNLEAARTTPFGEYVMTEMEKHSEGIDDLLEATDFDLRRDLSEIVVGATGLQKETRALILARGAFNPDRIIAHAEAHGSVLSTFGDVRMLRGQHERSPALAFLSMDLVAVGKTEDVLAAIERLGEQENAGTPAAVRAIELSNSNHAWCVAVGSPAELTGRDDLTPDNSPIRGDLIRSIRVLSGGVSFGETVILTASAETETPDAAMALGSVVQFFLSFARLNAEDPDMAALLGRMLSDLSITTQATSVTLTLPVAQADLEAFLRLVHGNRASRHETKRPVEQPGERSGRRTRSGGSR